VRSSIGLATVPSARRVRERLDVSLYARDPIALVTKLSARALEAEVPYAVTGATGAAALGAPVSTAVPITLVRIAPDVPSLAEAAQLLGVEPVDAGANMALIRDVGELGLHGRVFQWIRPRGAACPHLARYARRTAWRGCSCPVPGGRHWLVTVSITASTTRPLPPYYSVRPRTSCGRSGLLLTTPSSSAAWCPGSSSSTQGSAIPARDRPRSE